MRDIRNILNIGAGDIIGNTVSAGFWIYLAILITPENFGELHFFISVVAITSYLVLIGTQNTITVYVAKKIPIQSTFNFISLIGALIAFLILLFIFKRPDMGFLVFGYVINNLVISHLLGNKEYKNYSKYVLIQKTLTPLLGLGLFFMFGIDYVIFGLALSYVAYSFKIFEMFKEIKIDFSLLYNRKAFIINNYFISLTGTLQGQIDKIIVMPILGSALLGNYSLSLQIISIMMIFSSVIFKYLVPQEASGRDTKFVKKILIISGFSLTLIGFLIVPIVLPEIFPEYNESIEAIKIMSLSLLPMSITKIFDSKFLSLEKNHHILISTSISLIVLILTMILFGTWYGISGIASSFVLAMIIQAVYYFIIDKWKYDGIKTF
jgi:O-antigen/teichoic acid export membrane protein